MSTADGKSAPPADAASEGVPDILKTPDSDPGDETQRNFRYQHSYGVILLIHSRTGSQPYVSVFCEHHEDYLCERNDSLFDAYQIKTRKPEQGHWKLGDEPVKKSIQRFVALSKLFPDSINAFYFVSNAELFITTVSKQRRHSPALLFESAKELDSWEKLDDQMEIAFEDLRSFCDESLASNGGCDASDLWNVLQRLHFIKGPGRDDFEDVLAHSHLPLIEECKNLSPVQLNGLKDELIDRICRASSLSLTSPLRYLPRDNNPDSLDPIIQGKRVGPSDLMERIKNFGSLPFRYRSGSELVKLGSAQSNLDRLRKKLTRARLASQFDTMQRRALSAEQHLMELTYRIDNSSDLLNHILGVVKGVCDDSLLRCESETEPFGQKMLQDVTQQLNMRVSEFDSEKVGINADCLLGVAGLLTGECEVWWGKQFDLQGEVVNHDA